LEFLEKRRFNEKAGIDRDDLLKSEGAGPSGPRRPYGGSSENLGKGSDNRRALFEGASGGKKKKEADPFQSNLPDIDDDELVKDDFNKMNERNKLIVSFSLCVELGLTRHPNRTMNSKILERASKSSRTLPWI
jgi:hypothetical protein